MNDIELNRAVAKAAGWVYQNGWEAPNGDRPYKLPDFANYYDEILPLVKALKNGRENRFVEKLIEVVHPDVCIRDNYIHTAYCHALITATPRQLCEAYLAVGGADA